MARHDKVSPEGDARIKELLLAGHSCALVARITGVNEKGVASRRAELKRIGAKFPMCECGRSVSHAGRCSFRVKRYLATPDTSYGRGRVPRVTHNDCKAWDSHRRRIAAVPVPCAESSAIDLLRFVEKIIPKKVLPDIRDDLIQDILVAILSGELKTDAIAGALPMYVRKLYAMFPTLGGPVSLSSIVHDHQYVFGGGEVTLLETIPDDHLRADELLEMAEEDDPDDSIEYISNLHALELGSGMGTFRKRNRGREETEENTEFERKPVVAQAARSPQDRAVLGANASNLKLNPDHARGRLASAPLKTEISNPISHRSAA